MRFFIILLFVLFAVSTQATDLATGTWRGIIDCQGNELPFTFEVVKKNSKLFVYLHNGAEKLELDEVSIFGDSVKMVLHVFDAEIRARIEGKKLSGRFIKNYAPQASQDFHATFGETYRFVPNSKQPSTDFSGKYQVEFKTKAGKLIASVGVFQQDGNHVTGSFLTTTGDYRYLEGNVVDGKMMLSAFDGNHAYVFHITRQGDSLRGDFYSGKLSHQTLKAVRNANAALPDPESLTYLKPGYDKIEFHFPDLQKKIVSLSDEKYKNKVVILQISGSWCPNCMDETRYLVPWYEANRKRGVEIIGLAYERKDDFAYASERVKKMIDKFHIGYDFLIAGTDNTEKASQTLPMLNRIMGFPTTIIIGKDGKVRNIHTGFEGPATGIYFEQYKEHFNQIINELLAEPTPASH